jgi:hypothetical protein
MFPNRLLPALLPILCNAGLASAHGLFVHYDVEPPDHVVITAFWYADEPASGAKVRVLDPDGEVIAASTANAQGQYTFTAPAARAYRFEVIASGHKAECQLTPEAAALLSATDGHAQNAADTESPPPPAAAPDNHPHEHEDGPAHSHADEQDLDADHVDPWRSVAAHGGWAEPWFGSGLISGLALILAGAAFVMTLSLRREIRILKHGCGGQGR